MAYTYQYEIAGIVIQIQSELQLSSTCCMEPFVHNEFETVPQVRFFLRRASGGELPTAEPVYQDEYTAVWADGNRYRIGYRMIREGRPCRAWIIPESEQNKYSLCADEQFFWMFHAEGKIYSYLMIEQILLDHQGFYLHSAFVKYNGTGIIFSAPSGTGKSTQASLWEKYRGAEIINGDRTVLRKQNGGFVAYGSPYAGSSQIWKNESAPLKAIILLSQGPENVIRPAQNREAIRRLFPEILVNSWNPDFMDKVTSLLDCLIRTVPIYCLSCRPDEGAVELVERTLFG